ncbi:MAG: hypothetical protein QOF25_5012, partial [Mycobacterium sp.]|nr:hypothetical protein [Mycobacterium sp.]
VSVLLRNHGPASERRIPGHYLRDHPEGFMDAVHQPPVGQVGRHSPDLSGEPCEVLEVAGSGLDFETACVIGIPAFLDSNSARVSTCCRMRPAKREMQAPLSRPGILAHGPRNARQHDCTAASTCSGEAGVTRKSTSLTDGSRTSWARPPSPLSQRPPVRTWASSPSRGKCGRWCRSDEYGCHQNLLEYVIIGSLYTYTYAIAAVSTDRVDFFQ